MTQGERMLKRLRNGETLNRWDCLHKMDPGIWEAPARISELIKKGHPIKVRYEVIKPHNGQRKVRIAHWYMDGPAQGVLL